jgi:hypothetical protein
MVWPLYFVVGVVVISGRHRLFKRYPQILQAHFYKKVQSSQEKTAASLPEDDGRTL